MLTFLIMAGGSGERFWPLSTKEKPKQLLKIFSDKSLIRLAFERVLPLAGRDRIFVATNELQYMELKKELPELDDSRIIIEPAFKDTASAIAYGSAIISKYYENPTICVLASDHLIKDEDEFRKVIKIAELDAEEGNIVTLGIVPTYPETGYGYIEVSKPSKNMPTKALAFKEKPNLEVATEYFTSKRYMWNSGMFIFKYDVIMEALRKYSPNHYYVANKLKSIIYRNDGLKTARDVMLVFNEFEKKSIDFAVMELADNIDCIPVIIGWNDVGNYLAFDELFEKDVNLNICKNVKYKSIDSNNNIIIADKETYQTLNLIGIKDKIIVITKNNILICEKEDNQEIKKLINMGD